MKKILEKPTLLLLSKHLDIRRWIRRLAQNDFYLLEETNATSAIETSRSTEISFLLIDATIEEEIFALCQKIKEVSHLDSSPLFLISGKLNKSFLDQAIKNGISGIIAPFSDKEDFLGKLKQAQKAIETKEKISSLSTKFKKAPPLSSPASLKKKIIWSEPILKEAKKLAQEKAFLMLIVEVDNFSTYENEAKDEILAICQKEWKKHFSEQQALFPLTEGKFVALFSEISSKELEKNAKNFQKSMQNQPLSSSKKKNSFSLSLFFSSIKEKELLKNEQISAFFDQMLLKADTKLQESQGVGQFFVDLQG
jgi:PleD family two-component response regulator